MFQVRRIGCRIIQSLLEVLPDVSGGVVFQPFLQGDRILERLQAHAFVLQPVPQLTHERVVPVAALAVHAVGHTVSFQRADEGPLGDWHL